jgi:cytochrome b561
MMHPLVLAGMGGGLVLGSVVGLVGLHFTEFEATPQGRYYKSHPYIGISIAALLVIRMAYRMTALTGNSPQAPTNPAAMQSPLTLAIFGLLAGYYITFYAGVLVRSDKLEVPAQSVL